MPNNITLYKHSNGEYTLTVNGKPIPSSTVGITAGVPMHEALSTLETFLANSVNITARLDGDYTDTVDSNVRYITDPVPLSFVAPDAHNIQTVDKFQG